MRRHIRLLLAARVAQFTVVRRHRCPPPLPLFPHSGHVSAVVTSAPPVAAIKERQRRAEEDRDTRCARTHART